MGNPARTGRSRCGLRSSRAAGGRASDSGGTSRCRRPCRGGVVVGHSTRSTTFVPPRVRAVATHAAATVTSSASFVWRTGVLPWRYPSVHCRQCSSHLLSQFNGQGQRPVGVVDVNSGDQTPERLGSRRPPKTEHPPTAIPGDLDQLVHNKTVYAYDGHVLSISAKRRSISAAIRAPALTS